MAPSQYLLRWGDLESFRTPGASPDTEDSWAVFMGKALGLEARVMFAGKWSVSLQFLFQNANPGAAGH